VSSTQRSAAYLACTLLGILKVQFSSLAIGNLVLLAPHLVLLAPHLVLLAPHKFSSVQLQLGLGRTPAVAENLRVKLGYRTNA
jgi:hypothetical protein